MSEEHIIFALVVASIIGAIIKDIRMLPVLRIAASTWRRSGSFLVLAGAVTDGWVLAYLSMLLASYLTGWNPGRWWVPLAAVVAALPWCAEIWWELWLRRRDGEDSDHAV